MITNITLENFKCFRKVSIDPKQVTLFIGPNGTGKSGILQALLLLKQSTDASRQLNLSGRFVSLTPEEFMLHGVDPERDAVCLALSGYTVAESKADGVPAALAVRLEFSPNGGRHGDYRGSVPILRPPDPDREESLIRELALLPIVLQNLRTVPAARGLSRQIYPLGSTPVDDITTTAGLSQQENDVVTTLGYLDPVVARISNWVKQVTSVGFKASLVPSQSIRPVSITLTGEVSLVAECFGTNALVQLLLELARAAEGATVLMEEPEIHLHPRAQAELTSVIVEEAKASNKQVIMTTHSEHIANRLLTLVAEGKISPEEIAIYSFEKDEETGVCSVSEIEVTPRGQVKGGLKSFFEAHMEEMRRYGDALRAQI